MSLGALTTLYEPPSSCISSFSTDFRAPDNWDIFGPLDTFGDCFPPNYTDDENKYYSPGICPAGYTAACAYPAPGLGGGQTSVTTATCCPTGFACQSSRVAWLGSTFACTSKIISFLGPQVFVVDSFTLSTSTATILEDEHAVANAFGIQIQYRYEDFISTSTTVSSTTVSTSSSTTSTIQPTISDSPDQNHQGGLSTAAAIGIGVGVGFAALLLIGGVIVAVCVRRRRGRKLSSQQNQGENDAMRRNNAGYTHPANMEQASAKQLPIGLTNHPVAELEQPRSELGEHRSWELGAR
ncbi:hypothetical protein F5B17DRAFT_78359 [Nemania serpens]|nr:hypothetical protein F5B17DRAFT_78359 [Nemania serpens]